MNNMQLRNHIPIAGTGNREPCTGMESPFRVSLGFTPAWFTKRLGVDFSERWHTAPVYRYDSITGMKSFLTKMFPSVDNFRPKIEDGVDYDCATLSAVYGAQFYAIIYNQPVQYFRDNWPLVSSKSVMTREEIENLPPFDPETNPGFQSIIKQMDEIYISRAALRMTSGSAE